MAQGWNMEGSLCLLGNKGSPRKENNVGRGGTENRLDPRQFKISPRALGAWCEHVAEETLSFKLGGLAS